MTIEYNPKVSIIIPVYNGANFLKEAIESAIAQTYSNIEIIVVNDGSTDNGETEAIAKQYGERIKYYKKENGGVSSALNYGIKKMTGEYFSWLSHDDLYTPEKIEHSIETLNRYNNIKENLIVYSDGIYVKEDKTKIKSFRNYFEKEKIYTGIEAANIVACKGTLYGCSLLIPRKAFYEVGFFNEELRYSQDALMWYMLFLNGYSICLSLHKDVLARMHKNQVTITRKDLFRHDSLYIAKILAPLFKEKSKILYFNYLKRLTSLPCEKTIEFLFDYAQKENIFSTKQIMILKSEKYLGKRKYSTKTFIKKILIR